MFPINYAPAAATDDNYNDDDDDATDDDNNEDFPCCNKMVTAFSQTIIQSNLYYNGHPRAFRNWPLIILTGRAPITPMK